MISLPRRTCWFRLSGSVWGSRIFNLLIAVAGGQRFASGLLKRLIRKEQQIIDKTTHKTQREGVARTNAQQRYMMVDSNHVVSGLQRLFGETRENILNVQAGCWKWAVMFANKSKGVKIPSCKLSVPDGGG